MSASGPSGPLGLNLVFSTAGFNEMRNQGNIKQSCLRTLRWLQYSAVVSCFYEILKRISLVIEVST